MGIIKVKININGKEIEIDEKNTEQLSDEELEAASGGGLRLPDGTIFYRWVCRTEGCGAASDWFEDSSEVRRDLAAHIIETGHALYYVTSKTLL